MTGAAAAPPRARGHRLGGAGARDLHDADGGGKSQCRRPPGRLESRSASTICFRGFAERRRNLGNQFSGGEQQMLAVARALMTNPSAAVARRAARRAGADLVEELAAAPGAPASELDGVHSGRAACRYRAGADAESIVLERGRIVYQGASASLLADHAALDRLIGLRLAEV